MDVYDQARSRGRDAVPFTAFQATPAERRPHLVLDTNRKTLRSAPAFEFNRSTGRWERVEDDYSSVANSAPPAAAEGAMVTGRVRLSVFTSRSRCELANEWQGEDHAHTRHHRTHYRPFWLLAHARARPAHRRSVLSDRSVPA